MFGFGPLKIQKGFDLIQKIEKTYPAVTTATNTIKKIKPFIFLKRLGDLQFQVAYIAWEKYFVC